MKKKFTILIADRNRHVRDFLMREMMKEGYDVCVAKNGGEILDWIFHHDSFDLLILDPDLRDAGEIKIIEMLNERKPSIPVIVHAFLSDYNNHLETFNASAYVEKEGDSIERLKDEVSRLLENFKPPGGNKSEKDIFGQPPGREDRNQRKGKK